MPAILGTLPQAPPFTLGTPLLRDALDSALALVLLVLVSPLLALVALAIRLEDGGPALYRQERVGLQGRVFTILKLRSMRVDAEADGRARCASRGDSRVTLIGRLIRRTRIDELPQLLNVLRGEMRLIGPRPERPCFVARLNREIPCFDLRHVVKPGITGLAQVHVGYTDDPAGAADKLRYDLDYIHRRSLPLDFIILALTVQVVLTGRGAC